MSMTFLIMLLCVQGYARSRPFHGWICFRVVVVMDLRKTVIMENNQI